MPNANSLYLTENWVRIPDDAGRSVLYSVLIMNTAASIKQFSSFTELYSNTLPAIEENQEISTNY